MLLGENGRTRSKLHPVAILYTTNTKRPALGLNMSLHGQLATLRTILQKFAYSITDLHL